MIIPGFYGDWKAQFNKKGKIKFICHHEFSRSIYEEWSTCIRAICVNYYWIFPCFQKPYWVMASSNSKTKKASEMLVRWVKWKAQDFKLSLAIAKSLDPTGAQSQISSKVLLVNDIRSHFSCTIQDIGTLEMD